MKFKFRTSTQKKRLQAPGTKRKKLCLRGTNTLRALKCKSLCRNYAADAFGRFEEFEESKKSRLYKRLFERLRARKARQRQGKDELPLATSWGILFGVAGIALLSMATILLSVFLKYNMPYTEIVIPDTVSLSLEDATAIQPDVFEYVVLYKSNPEHAPNTVTAQNPLPSVKRKFYSGKDKIKITLTVNTQRSVTSIPELVGTPLRDALIFLQHEGLSVKVLKQYSSEISAGNIIYSSAPAGTLFKSGEQITLTVSQGKEKIKVLVPSFIGMSENEAISLLAKKQLKLGEIKYAASSAAIGTVIAQSIAKNTVLPEQSKISLTVSGGLYYEEN